MRNAILIFFFLSAWKGFAQKDTVYTAWINSDTTRMTLTQAELEERETKRVMWLSSRWKKKRKKIKEETSGNIKLLGNDTVFWFGSYHFFDEYMLVLIGTKKQIKKHRYELTSIQYRRIRYEEIELLETDGRVKSILPQLYAGMIPFTTGPVLIAKSFIGGFQPLLIPVGILSTYLGYRIIDPITTKEYYMKNWFLSIELVNDR